MLSYVMRHAWLSVTDPKHGAVIVLKLEPSRRTLIEMAALVIVLNVLVSQAFAIMIPSPASGSLLAALATPVPSLIVHAILLVVITFATFGIGRMLGGEGTLDETFLLLIWLQFIMLVANLLQIVVAILWTPLGALAALVSFVLFLWLFVNFVLVLHGFRSILKVLLASVASFFALIFLITASISLFGLIL